MIAVLFRRSETTGRVLLALLAVSVLPALTWAAQAPPEIVAAIDEMVAERHRSDAPGLVMAVIQNGEIVYETAAGMADLERGVALHPGSVLEVGSVSKQFTAMAVLLLEHDGRLTLDDDVRTWVPELPDYGSTITIRHLLYHTSGIRDVETLYPLAGWPYVNFARDEQTLELITRQRRLNFEPGAEHLYSNSGYILLAQIVERVSGQPFPKFAEARIFGPLGMRNTIFWDDPGLVVSNRAVAYAPTEDGWANALWNLPFDGPSGVYTTVGDLARWDANFYDNRLGGGVELIERMETPGVLANGEVTEYAAGLFLSGEGDRRTIEHSGAWMGYRANLVRYPEHRLTIAVLANGSRLGLSASAVAELFLPPQDDRAVDEAAGATDEFVLPETMELPVARLARFEAAYWNESDGLVRTIELRDGVLMYVRGGSATELGAIGEREFLMVGPSIRVDVAFPEPADGQQTMTVEVAGSDRLEFERIVPLAVKAREAFVGDYWSDELQRGLELREVDGELRAAWAGDEPVRRAWPVAENELLVRGFVEVPWYPQDVRLEVEWESGRVVGLRLSCDMVRGVELVRVEES